MLKEYWSPGVGEGIGTQVENRRERSRGAQRWRAAVLAVLGLVLHAACATGYPMGGTLAGNDRHQRPPLAKSLDAKKRAAKVHDGAVAEDEAGTVAPH